MKEKWYEHKVEVVMENDKCKIQWSFTVHTNHKIYGKEPDVIVVHEDIFFHIIDFNCLSDGRVDTKKLEKIKHYTDLARELRMIWDMNVKLYH